MAKAATTAKAEDRVKLARTTLLEGVGREIAESFPGLTRLAGQIVAAMYISDGPLSMDELSRELGRSKSNIFANLRGLEAAGIVTRQREAGARHDSFALRGKYPDVVVGAYVSRLRRVVVDKVQLSQRSLELLGDDDSPEANALRAKLRDLKAKYERFAMIFESVIPGADGPIDLEALLDVVPMDMILSLASAARVALGLTDRPKKR
jgi:DNA-binding transcriptional regulator GbsR (MarR family)